jgi:iron(III) transport system substrate-binding protein
VKIWHALSAGLVALLSLVPATAPAADTSYPASYAQVIEAARKEGKLVVYSSTDSASAEPLLQEFQKLYPFVKLEYSDLNTTEVYNRFIGEAAAGTGTADLLWSSSMDLQLKLVNEGQAQAYASPEIPALPKSAVWQNLAYGTTLEPVVIVYNKRLLPADAVPKSHADLLRLIKEKPDLFKGKVTAFDPEKSGVGFMFHTQTARLLPAYWDLVAALGAGGDRFYTSTGAMIEKVSSGEHLVGFTIIGSYALLRSRKDPTLGIVYPKDFTLAFSRIAFIPKQARNPNAAKLFLDFLLSRRAQQIMASKSLIYALREDVEGEATHAALVKDLGDALKPIPVSMSLLESLEPAKRLEFLKHWKHSLAR